MGGAPFIITGYVGVVVKAVGVVPDSLELCPLYRSLTWEKFPCCLPRLCEGIKGHCVASL